MPMATPLTALANASRRNCLFSCRLISSAVGAPATGGCAARRGPPRVLTDAGDGRTSEPIKGTANNNDRVERRGPCRKARKKASAAPAAIPRKPKRGIERQCAPPQRALDFVRDPGLLDRREGPAAPLAPRPKPATVEATISTRRLDESMAASAAAAGKRLVDEQQRSAAHAVAEGADDGGQHRTEGEPRHQHRADRRAAIAEDMKIQREADDRDALADTAGEPRILQQADVRGNVAPSARQGLSWSSRIGTGATRRQSAAARNRP